MVVRWRATGVQATCHRMTHAGLLGRRDFRGSSGSRGRAVDGTMGRTREDLPGRFFLSRASGAVGGAGRAAQVVGETMLLRLAVRRVGDPEDRGGVDGHEGPEALGRGEGLSAAGADGDPTAEDRPRRGHPEADHDLRPDQPQLLLEPRATGLDLALARSLVDATLPAAEVLRPLEMLH